MHELKAHLGIDIQQINFEVSPVANDAGSYRVVCTILNIAAAEPLEIELTVRAPVGNEASNGGRVG